MDLLTPPETATRLRRLADLVKEAREWDEKRRDKQAISSHGSASRCATLRDRAAATARAMLPALRTLDAEEAAKAELSRLP